MTRKALSTTMKVENLHTYRLRTGFYRSYFDDEPGTEEAEVEEEP